MRLRLKYAAMLLFCNALKGGEDMRGSMEIYKVVLKKGDTLFLSAHDFHEVMKKVDELLQGRARELVREVMRLDSPAAYDEELPAIVAFI